VTPPFGPILAAFGLPSQGTRVEPWGSGHIHDSYRLTTNGGESGRRFLLQRLNANVFPDPVEVTESIRRVTDHLRAKLPPDVDAGRRVLALRQTQDGSLCHRDDAGALWRTYDFVAGARTYDLVRSPTMARRAAVAFGSFQRDLADLPPPRLPETLADFHHTPARFAALQRAVEEDVAGRAGEAAGEIEDALAREALSRVLHDAWEAGEVPERVTHNDTKINNLLFDEQSGEALCVIDLDTVMPGLGLFDVGDLIRTSGSRAAEDERDLARVVAEPELVAAIVTGYVDAMGALLTPVERRLLVVSGEVITFEIGLRFLTDFLEGDTYFKTARPEHNLDRCRAQFALLASLEQQRDRVLEMTDSSR
jgi:hypothetical protein